MCGSDWQVSDWLVSGSVVWKIEKEKGVLSSICCRDILTVI